MVSGSNISDSIPIWPWWIRLIHWALVLVFVANYFLLEPGSALHNWLGYGVTVLIILRIALGFSERFSKHSGYAAFVHCDLKPQAFAHHLNELKQRKVPAKSGHNPFGWLMVFFFWFLVVVLAVSGFLMEEMDYFFGNQTLGTIHLWSADAMLIAAFVHVAAVLLVAYWGRISLIRPMLTGKRKAK